MSVEAIASLGADQARADTASLRLAEAIAAEVASPAARPGSVENSHAVVAAARVDLAQADAAIQADEVAATAPTQPDASSNAGYVHTGTGVVQHLVEVTV